MQTNRQLLLILFTSLIASSAWGLTLNAQSDEASEDSTESEKEFETPPLPPLDLEDEKLNQDLERYRKHLEAREFSKALAIIKRVRSKVRKPEESIAVVIDRYFREADGGTVFDKAMKYHDREQYRKSLSTLIKEDPKGDAYEGTRIGEELAELREFLIAEIYLLIDDFEKESAEEEDDDEEEEGRPEGRGRQGQGQGGNSKVVGGTPEDGDVRSGKFALHWQTTERLSWVTLGNKAFEKMLEEGESLTDYRYLTLSLRCENPAAKPNILLLFDVDGAQIRAPRGGMRRAGARAYQRDGFNFTVNPKGGWREYRLDLKKFVRKGEVDWDMVEALRLIYTGGPDHLIMIDDVKLEKP
ncbi:MAG: hypothetical protein CBC13_10845 [Planctomycetia bacterium TMED53]|nr:MAG: hypothetical protein CBC13_10845 [Planctomycetia bacterium TMED53]